MKATVTGERRSERKRIAEELEALGKRLPDLKSEYASLLRRDEIEFAADVHGEAVEVFDRIQQLERAQFFDSLDMIGRCSTTKALEIAEKILAEALQPLVSGPVYEDTSADGSMCVVVHEGVVPVQRYAADRMARA